MIRGQEGNFLTLIKGMYKNPTANIILDGERLTALSLRPGAGQCLFSAFLFNISPEVLATVIRKETEMKYRFERKKQTVPIYRWNDCVLTKSQRSYKKKKILELISEFNRVSEYKISMWKSIFYILVMNRRKENHYAIYNHTEENEILQYKTNKTCI